MNLRALAVSSTAVLVLTLSACGSSSVPDLDAGGDAKAASGAEVKGDGYTFHVPSGWKQAADKAGQARADTVALAPDATAGFTPNINVVITPDVVKGQLSDADYTKGEKELVSALEGAGGSNVHIQPRLNMDDETALHITSNAKQGDLEYQTNQYIGFHKGSEYVVTFSFPSSFQESQYLEVTEPTMASWNWS